ncbi:MAG TPA: magnesium transporter [Thermoanaerobaculia bacterium]|nr:magnesium transporter [Thermoanaerobaculia bacterium]
MNRTSTQQLAPSSARSYQQVFSRLLRHDAVPQVRKIIEKMLPADISPVLPLLMVNDRRRVVSLLIETGKAARVILELDEADLAEFLEEIDDETLAAVCSSSAPDDAADLLDVLSEERRAEVLSRVGAAKQATLEALMTREEAAAGSLMNTDYLALDESLTVADAIDEIRRYPRKESFFYVYTVDPDHHLVGVLTLRSLIMASPETKLNAIMVQNVVRTTVDASQEEVARLVAKYDLLSIPVVDAQNQMVGVVTVDDVLDVIQEEAEEDLLHLGGVMISERVGAPVLTSYRLRIPWLIMNLVTAFAAAGVVRYFEGTIGRWTALAAFMPIVAGMGGNAGTQTLTVFVRGLALGEIEWKTRWKPVAKELGVGLGNGLTLGLLAGLIVGFWTGQWHLAAILYAGMTCTMLIAGVAGGLVPLALKEMGFDPAISSPIFVTTFTDVAGFFTFLGLATLVLRYWG